jgi:hypothetical protein
MPPVPHPCAAPSRMGGNLTLRPHSIMQPEKLNAAEPELMVRSRRSRLRRIHGNLLLESPHIARPHRPAVAMNSEIEPRIPKPISRRLKRERPILMRLGLHDHHRVPMRQRKHHLDARRVETRNAANRIASRIDHIPGRAKLAHPRRLHQSASLAAPRLQHIAGHPSAAVHRRKRNIQLLQPPAEDHRECRSKWLEESMPFRPGIQFVAGSLLVEISHLRRHPRRIIPAAGQALEVLQEPPAPALHQLQIVLVCIAPEEISANAARANHRPIEPRALRQPHLAPG